MTATIKIPKKKDSLLDRAMSRKPKFIIPIEDFLEPHELLMPNERRQNIIEAQKKGLIKANVLL